MATIGERISGLLNDRRWTQAELARRCGVTRAAISNICRGNEPSLALLRKMASELGVHESDLIDGTEASSRADSPGDPFPETSNG